MASGIAACCWKGHMVERFPCSSLLSCCLQPSDEALIMPKEAVDVEALNAAGGELNNAMTNPFFGAL